MAGATHTVVHEVLAQHSVRHLVAAPGFTARPEVISTGLLVAVCEWPAMRVLDAYLDPGECCLGTGVRLTHRAPALVGSLLTVTATAILVDGGYSCWRVCAYDEVEPVARGTVEFTVVDVEAFTSARVTPTETASWLAVSAGSPA